MSWMAALVAAWSTGKILSKSKNSKWKEVLPMSRRMRTYFYAVLGAIGGLIGWQVSDRLGLSFISNLYLSEVLVGLLIGLLIGLTEGLLTQNPIQVLKSGLFCGLLGVIAGGIGLPLGEFLFQA